MKRYCRFCHRELPPGHYFFCNDTCAEKFGEEYITLDELEQAQKKLDEWYEEMNQDILVVIPDCKRCKKDCKVRVKEKYLNQSFIFSCNQYERREDLEEDQEDNSETPHKL